MMPKIFDKNLKSENPITIMRSLLDWLVDNIFTLSSTIQFAIIVACGALGWLMARSISNWFKHTSKIDNKKFITSLLFRFHLTFYELLLLLCTPILLWISTFVVSLSNLPNQILNIAAALLTAWAIARLFTGIIRQHFWSKVAAGIIWFFAALYIVGWLTTFLTILNNFVFTLGSHKISLLSILKGVIIIIFLLWLANIFTKSADNVLSQTKSINLNQRKLLLKIIKFFFATLAIIIGLNAFGLDLTALTVFGGVLGVSIGVGLQKISSNLLSGLVLLADKSVKPGDMISVAETTGWVTNIGARCVSIITRDGKQHFIPNEILITTKIENWSFDSNTLRIAIPVIVSWDADRHLVKKLLLECAKTNPNVLEIPEPLCIIKSFTENRVEMELWVWINDPINGISVIRTSLYEEIWDKFKEYNIENPSLQHTIQISDLNILNKTK